MMIKVQGVQGVANTGRNPYEAQEKQVTKFYKPQEKKEKVKEDFGMVLDAELDNLHFSAVV